MYFFALLDLLIPLFLICTGTLKTVIYFFQKKNFEKWPVVAAEVVYCKLYDSPHEHSFMGREYEAIIHFKYTFRGNEYQSKTPFLKGYKLFSDMGSEKNILQQFKVGDIKNARVNPKIPELAYFSIKPIHWPSTILVPIGAVLYLGFMFGYYTMIKNTFF